MREDLALDTVFQWRNNRATIGIIFRICRKHKQYIQRKPKFESTDLHITFFQNIEQRHLDPCLQIGELIDHKYATVTSWDDTIMYYTVISKTQFKICCLDRINITDQVCNTYIRCCQFFAITLRAMQPFDRSRITLFPTHFTP